MAVQEKDILTIGCANMPENDNDIIGGAAAPSVKLEWEDLSTVSTAKVVSDASGDTTQTINLTGRNVPGELVTETAMALNGTTFSANSSITFDRFLKAVKSASTTGNVAIVKSTALWTGNITAAGADYIDLDVTDTPDTNTDAYRFYIIRIDSAITGAYQLSDCVKYEGSADPYPYRVHTRDWRIATPSTDAVVSIYEGMIMNKFSSPAIEVITVVTPFWNLAAEELGGSDVVVYCKGGFYNMHQTKALTSAYAVELQTGIETGANDFIQYALASTLGDTGTSANRLTAPSGYTFNNTDKDVANSGNFSPNTYQMFWLKLTLPDGQAAQKTFYQLKLVGKST